jgi:hypothetical protein
VDKFIQGFSQGSSKQKIVLTILVALGLVLLISFFYFFTNPAPQNTNNENSKELNPTPTTTSLDPVQPDSSWIVYQGENYELIYPPKLTSRPGVITDGAGGTSFTLTGKEEGIDYTIELQVTSASDAPLESYFATFRGLKYEESQMIIANQDAKKFSGKAGKFQETAAIFQLGEKIYKFQMSYKSENKNPKIEQIFEGVVSTFKLN